MGIVAKQSIYNTIITYVGFIFGAVNTLFLFTTILTEEYFGLVSYVLSASNLLWPLLAFGVPNTIIKFYNSYNSPVEKSRFISWLLLVPMVLVILFSLGYTVFYNKVFQHYMQSNPIVNSYVWVIILIGFASAYFEIFYAWSKVHLQTVKGNILKELFHRVLISILLVAVYFKWITPHVFVWALVGVFLLRTFLMKIVAFTISVPTFSLGKLSNSKSVITYASLILIAATVSVFLIDLDKVMIEHYFPIGKVALYTICAYMTSVIGVPTRAMLQITNPLSAKLLSQNDVLGLSELNKKSSITALIGTSWVALLVICNVHSLFELIPPPYILFIEVVFLLGLVKLFDAALGITNSVLFNSDAYQWILVFGVGVLSLAYFLNVWLIPIEGVVGAAFATFLAYIFYNIVKLIFVYYKFNIHPFSFKTLYVMLLVAFLWFFFYHWHIPLVHPLLSIVIKVFCITVVYFIIIYILRLSPEINRIINKLIKKQVQ